MHEEFLARFRAIAPSVEGWSLRIVEERMESVATRRDVPMPCSLRQDRGAMIQIWDGGATGYAATSDLSNEGLRRACERASDWARATRGRTVAEAGTQPIATASGEYASNVLRPWDSTSVAEKLDLLMELSHALHPDPRILDWSAALYGERIDSLLATSAGGHIAQRTEIVMPMLSVVANSGSHTQRRSFGGDAFARQGGLEILEQTGFTSAAPRVAEEALQLLDAPNCPTETLDLVLAPDQMILQIHESIGHPLELDRILGDERNYAGTSFVRLDMFGSYRYGSPLLNVVFDPNHASELAGYAFDDEGTPAERQYIIRDGILERPLGGTTSQNRAGIEGVANARASSWNRPPIDRMANLNLELGHDSFDRLIAGIERGVFMQTNCSWSIDDSRNKFQFGCERAQLIEDGELTQVVKNPNYRGVSATFWRSLAGVGDASTAETLGTPTCGKGEPNQLARVGHASPTCRFENVDVFGGE